MLGPPGVLPADFWTNAQMIKALGSWHIGQAIRAYRHHPSHGLRPLSQEVVAGWLNVTQTQLSRIESGPPIKDLDRLIAWSGILKIPTHLLWFKMPNQTNELSIKKTDVLALRHLPASPPFEDGATAGTALVPYDQERLRQFVAAWSAGVDRREFMKAGTGLAAGLSAPGLDLLTSLSHVPTPGAVREADIADVRSAARAFTSWDHIYGSGIVREAVTAQLRWSAGLLEAKCPRSLRNELFAAVGYLSGVCGAMAFDAYAHDDARRMFAFALSCAEVAGDWHYRAKMLSLMARQAIWCGNPDGGLTYAELALVRADRLTWTEQAMLHTARARALAKLGRAKETLAAVGQADEAFANSHPRDDPPWMAYYDTAQHQGDTGHALFDLAVQGKKVAAHQRLAAAVDGHSDAYARSRVFSTAKLSILIMITGDPHEATSLATRAIADAGQLRSRRVADILRELRSAADRHAQNSEVADLRARITKLVDAS
jgi:transcriptional regulator with XRE-family HTH domain